MTDENTEADKTYAPTFSWVKTHKEIVKWLKTKENDQKAIIELLKDVGIQKIKDKDLNDKIIELEEIDPFSFFFCIYKHSSKNRLKFLQRIAQKIECTIPNDESGIPSANALKVFLFPFKPERTHNEISPLWHLFKSVLNNSVTDEQFKDILTITGTAEAKLTEAMFMINPDKYFPIDGPTKPYLKEEFGIDYNFKSYTEYIAILDQIKTKTNTAFYELSYDAWLWNDQNKKNVSPEEFYSSLLQKGFDEKDLNEYFVFLQKIVKQFNLKPNDPRVSFNIPKKKSSGIHFLIGNHYAISLEKHKKGNLAAIASKERTNTTTIFKNSKPVVYYTHYNSYILPSTELDLIFDAIEARLANGDKSTKRQTDNNEDFENYAFGIQHPTEEPPFLNTILYGPPGTGKTYNTILRAAEIIEERKIGSYNEALEVFNKNLHDRIEFITFHQNYSYEDFIQGLRPDVEDNEKLTFERKDGIFKVIADKALKNLEGSEKPEAIKKIFEEVFNQFIDPLVEGEIEEIEIKMKQTSYFITAITTKSIDFRKSNGNTAHTLSIATLKKMYEEEYTLNIQGLSSYYSPLLKELLAIGKDPTGAKEPIKKQNYVLIIDEINRANISRVFGELITLIEPDKRYGGKIPMEAKLPSGDTFIVPSNLYIIGTMNTADKSIALLDIALRRRFEFESMYPKYKIDGHEIYDIEILKNINQQIIKSKGHDFQIGHSYFMGDNKDLVSRMNKKVIPLLLEYYMNDEKEVKNILTTAGLELKADSWPIEITGKKK